MKKILMTIIAAAALGASGYTVHRSFKNGYPTGSGPGRNTGVSVGVNGASFSSQDGAAKKGKEKLKDDGTCWAVTEAGTRCRHKKDGASDYCKQHGPNVKATKPLDRCRALKWDGERCGRKPEEGYLYCPQHRKLGAK